MATELQAAEVKVRIETEEAIRQVDAIEKEQMRRTAARRPGPDQSVQRPDAGYSAINGMPESVPAGTTGDARESRLAFGGDQFLRNTPIVEQVGMRAMTNTPIVQSSAEMVAEEASAVSQRALSMVGRASGFVSSPASALGAELSSASIAAAGPYGAAIAAAAITVPVASATGPTAEGAATGALMGLLSSSPVAAGVAVGAVHALGLSRIAGAYRTITSTMDALGMTATDTSFIAFASARLGTRCSPDDLASSASAMMRANTTLEFWKSRQNIDRERIGALLSAYTFEQQMERFLAGGSH